MQNLRLCLVLLSMLAWGSAHAGLLDRFFGLPTDIENNSAVVTPPPLIVDQPIVVSSNVSDYRLGAGDKLNITVFGEKELSMETSIVTGKDRKSVV